MEGPSGRMGALASTSWIPNITARAGGFTKTPSRSTNELDLGRVKAIPPEDEGELRGLLGSTPLDFQIRCTSMWFTPRYPDRVRVVHRCPLVGATL